MSAAPEDLLLDHASPESLRREADRQTVGLLRRNHEDNRQIITLLTQAVDLLRESKVTAPSKVTTPNCAETGFYPALN